TDSGAVAGQPAVDELGAGVPAVEHVLRGGLLDQPADPEHPGLDLVLGLAQAVIGAVRGHPHRALDADLVAERREHDLPAVLARAADPVADLVEPDPIADDLG